MKRSGNGHRPPVRPLRRARRDGRAEVFPSRREELAARRAELRQRAKRRRRRLAAAALAVLLLVGGVIGGGYLLYQGSSASPTTTATAAATWSSRSRRARPAPRSAGSCSPRAWSRASRRSPGGPRRGPHPLCAARLLPAARAVSGRPRWPAARSRRPGRPAGDPRRRAARRHQRPRRHECPGVLTPDLGPTLRAARRARRCVTVDELRAAMSTPTRRSWACRVGAEDVAEADPRRRLEGLLVPGALRRAARRAGVDVLRGLLATSATRLEAPACSPGRRDRLHPLRGADHVSLVEKEAHHPGHAQGRQGDLQPARRRAAARAGLHGQLPAGPAGAAHHRRTTGPGRGPTTATW